MTRRRYFKSVRPDGTSFHDRSFRWVPRDWTPADGPVTVEHPNYDSAGGAGGYLSVSTDPSDCTGMEWPCRLLIVESLGIDGVSTPDPKGLPHKRAGRAFRVVGERPAHEALGPNGANVSAIIAEMQELTPAAWAAARGTACAAARGTAWAAARDAVWDAVRDTVRNAAWNAAWAAAWDAAWDNQDAAWGAVAATLLRDLITPDRHETLMTPIEAARAVMREEGPPC